MGATRRLTKARPGQAIASRWPVKGHPGHSYLTLPTNWPGVAEIVRLQIQGVLDGGRGVRRQAVRITLSLEVHISDDPPSLALMQRLTLLVKVEPCSPANLLIPA